MAVFRTSLEGFVDCLAKDEISGRQYKRHAGRHISAKSTQLEVKQITLSGLQLCRLGKRCDNPLEVKDEVDCLAATFDRGRAKQSLSKSQL